MKNKFYILIFCALLFLYGCTRTQKFTFKYFNFDSDREMKLIAQVPKNFKIIRINEKETKLLYKDSIYLEGRDKNMLYWKEYFLDNIIIGYLKVPKERKKIFDQVMQSLDRRF